MHAQPIHCRNARLGLAAALLLAAGSIAAAQTTIHVAPCGNDAWSGLTKACNFPTGPKRTLAAAISAASSGDTIVVSDGVYAGPGNRDLNFGGKLITIRSSGGAAHCIIDCEGGASDHHRAFVFSNGETAAAVLEGLTIRNGAAPFGGAILMEGGSSPTISRCRFESNTAYPGATGGEGGAIRATGSSSRIADCTFIGNEAVRSTGLSGRGGAIQFLGGAPLLTRCTFEENTAGGGGGVHVAMACTPTLVECTFARNWTADSNFAGGGGFLGGAGGHSTFLNCRFVENQTARIAGALWISGSASTITGCSFVGNYGYDAACVGVANGGQATITNCLFAHNTADIFSSALEIWNGLGGPASVALRNCTFVANTTTPPYGAIVASQTSTLTGSNCILWDNPPAGVVILDSGAVTLTHSDVQGGWPGTGNIDQEPLLVTDGARRYTLRPGSPCIDTGDPTFAPAPCAHDLAGACRIWPGGSGATRVDMGAFEFAAPVGDLDGDCIIGIGDLNILLRNFNTSAGVTPGQGDLDGDGDVDAQDLKLLTSAFGQQCP